MTALSSTEFFSSAKAFAGGALRRLHADDSGLSTAELIMLAAFVLIPIIIAVGGFGSQIIGSLGSSVEGVEKVPDTIKWKQN